MNRQQRNLYLVWNPFQRRAQTLGTEFDLDVHYYHYAWEERGKAFKALSYLVKGLASLRDMIVGKPDYIFIQLAPTPLLYVTAFYCLFSRCRYVADCHNTMLYDSHWVHWPLAKTLLRKSHRILVHNTDVQAHAARLGLPSVILRDPLPIMKVPEEVKEVAGISLVEDTYVIVPCSMAVDEPLEELFEAARIVPETLFVFTWFVDRLPADLRSKAPANLRFTGFLDEPDFNALYANANAALVLTTREGTQPSGASEAISLGVPLVVSEIKTTRRLYENSPVYVDNSSASIADGVRAALADYKKWSENITKLKASLVAEADAQIDAVKTSLIG